MNITKGKRTFFLSAPWIVSVQGFPTLTPVSVANLVPEDATCYYVSCALSMARANSLGYIDQSCVVRLDGALDANYHSFTLGGQELPRAGEGGRLNNALLEATLGGILIPNINQRFYLLHQGNTIDSGVNITLELNWYERP